MILKIVRNEEFKKAGDKGLFHNYLPTMSRGCWIIGEIENIRYTCISKTDVADYIGSSRGYYDLAIQYLTKEKTLSSKAFDMAITFSDPSKKQFNIFLQDCTCYICNEDGKTVDKLIC